MLLVMYNPAMHSLANRAMRQLNPALPIILRSGYDDYNIAGRFTSHPLVTFFGQAMYVG